ncbi:MAG: C39 family peptidase [Candidatus Pacebacteria bacterium]|nr:C39 family peptidase [Candidatus Paceibacterota bacterium]
MKSALARGIYIWKNAEVLPVIPPPITTPATIVAPMSTSSVPDVPFYSQFRDIRSPQWQKVGCGITSLAMVIDYYSPNAVSVNTLLKQGIAAGAYEQNAGWIYAGLIQLSQKYGLDGTYHDLSKLDTQTAFEQFKKYVKAGPVILAVHYKFDPKSTIPHLVVIDAVQDGIVYYNDPAAKTGEKQIAVADFLKGWKRKVIVIRPTQEAQSTTLTKV